MDGVVAIVVVGLLTAVIGGGLGYGFAAVKFVAALHAANREKQELQRQLAAAAAARKQTGPSSLQPAVTVTSSSTIEVSQGLEDPRASEAAPSVESPKPQPTATIHLPAEQSPPSEPTAAGPWQQLIAETTTHSQADVLCMVDIDFLGQYRERYGQELGDYVSSHVEQVIRDSLREMGAVISRYEGQEFILAWPAEPGTAAKRLWAARQAAARLRADVEHAFLQLGTERLTVTISLGLALCEAGLAGEEVIARADEALAAAKRAGRNRGYYYAGQQCLPVEPLEAFAEPKRSDESRKQNRASNTSGLRERRRHERKPCSSINLLAPCSDGVLPAMDKFQRVQFFDISSSGFSMLVQTVPTASKFAVALINSSGSIFMAAEIANIRQAKRVAANDKPLLIVGCQFRQRLYPQETRNVKEGVMVERRTSAV